jgi:general stress protein 26
MKKTLFYLLPLFFVACEKNKETLFQDDVDAKQIIRSYDFPNNTPKKDVAYIKGKLNGKPFYINEGDENYPYFIIEGRSAKQLEAGQNPSTVLGGTPDFSYLQIRIGNITENAFPTVHLNTFLVKGEHSAKELLKKHLIVKDFATDRNNNKDTLGWEVELLYPTQNKELKIDRNWNPILSSFYEGKAQPANRYFKITSIEEGDFGNGRTQKITFKFDLEMFYVHRFSLFDRIENGEMVLFN